MTAEVAIYSLYDVQGANLQLHIARLPDTFTAVFGWDALHHVDGGPPDSAIDIFAESFVASGTVAFLDVPENVKSGPGWTRVANDSWLAIPHTLMERISARRPPWVRATNSAGVARRIFQGAVSWEMQTQVAFVLKRDALPEFGRDLVRDLLCARETPLVQLHLPDEVLALVLPAVDGDYVEVASRDPIVREAIRTAVAAACKERGIPFEVRGALQ